MNKKIKIIDLLNMQYKNEKMPKNIRIRYSLVFDYYTYNEEIKWYETADKTTILDVFNKLDYEVEILEDNTEIDIQGIEEISIDKLNSIDPYVGITKPEVYCINKQNEIIKAIKQLDHQINNK